MLRYDEFAEIIKTPEGKRRLSTLYYPNFVKRSSDIYIKTKLSDRLDILAYQYYGDSRYWVIISKVNNLMSPSLRVKPGITLRIPYPLNSSDIEESFLNKNKE